MSSDSRCCYCDGPCNPQSQACGPCMRGGHTTQFKAISQKRGLADEESEIEEVDLKPKELPKKKSKFIDDEALSELADSEAEDYVCTSAVFQKLADEVDKSIEVLANLHDKAQEELKRLRASILFEKVKCSALFE